MILNHINLTVTDVEAAAGFLEKYFGLQHHGGEHKFRVLFDDQGMVLTLMKGGQIKYPASFHIGFGQESEEKVNEINQRLKDDGFDVQPPQRSHAWTFYVQAPGGFMVEVLC
jgi:catechol 2,3-dioxygenase-like lactoylglutathione lyase family enzyme